MHTNHCLVHLLHKSSIQVTCTSPILHQDLSIPGIVSETFHLLPIHQHGVDLDKSDGPFSNPISQELPAAWTGWSPGLSRKPSSLGLLTNMFVCSLKNHWSFLLVKPVNFVISRAQTSAPFSSMFLPFCPIQLPEVSLDSYIFNQLKVRLGSPSYLGVWGRKTGSLRLFWSRETVPGHIVRSCPKWHV